MPPESMEFDRDGIREFIQQRPRAILRRGTGIIVALLCVIIVLGALIPYPETIRGKAVITTVEPLVRVVARTDGILKQLLVYDGDVADTPPSRWGITIYYPLIPVTYFAECSIFCVDATTLVAYLVLQEKFLEYLCGGARR